MKLIQIICFVTEGDVLYTRGTGTVWDQNNIIIILLWELALDLGLLMFSSDQGTETQSTDQNIIKGNVPMSYVSENDDLCAPVKCIETMAQPGFRVKAGK